MNKVQDAVSAFQSGFNCSQAIVRVYGPDYGLSALDCLRVSCGFGGGMRRGDTCGAVAGALMVLGLRYGPQEVCDTSAKTDVYFRVTEFSSRFESRCGSIVCRDLLGCDISTPEGMEHAKNNNLFETVCAKMVQIAAEILEEMC
ncbi:MAG: C-GCAxxG-C-C family protein [Planctomycetota bacterium]